MCKKSASLRLLIALFTITVFSLFTFTALRQAEALTVSGLSVESGESYQVVDGGLTNGALTYIDRGYTFSSTPGSLEGATYIKTANDDKASSSGTFLSFTVDEDVTVYVAHDDRISSRPSWLTSSFSDTGDNLVTTDTTLSIFESNFLAGVVTLGGNEGDGDSSMYSVIVGEGEDDGGDGGDGGTAGDCTDCPDAWDKQLTTDRFELVLPTAANPDGEAVRDNETCIVWELFPDPSARDWALQLAHCAKKKVGGRKGWRLASFEELASLVDDTQPAPKIPAELKTLIPGVQSTFYWSSTTLAYNTTFAWDVSFGSGGVDIGGKTGNAHVWCVRGGQGHDAY